MKENESVLLTQNQVAEMFGLKGRALEAMRHQGRGPKFIRLSGRIVRYRRSDVEAYLDAHAVTPIINA